MASERRVLAEQCKTATLDALRSLGGTARRDEIRERALLDGGFSDEQLAIPGPPGKPHDPTLAVYYIGWSLSWLKKEGAVYNVGRGVWSTTPPPGGDTGPLLIDLAALHVIEPEAPRRRAWWRRG